jgi:hypothetical protein
MRLLGSKTSPGLGRCLFQSFTNERQELLSTKKGNAQGHWSYKIRPKGSRGQKKQVDG